MTTSTVGSHIDLEPVAQHTWPQDDISQVDNSEAQAVIPAEVESQLNADFEGQEKVLHEEVLTAEQLAERQKALRELQAFMQKQQKRRRPIGSSLLCNLMRRI